MTEVRYLICPSSVTIASMDSGHADLLRDVDPVALGQRLRAARESKGLTQSQVAGDEISVGYVSRIESGQRRPNARVLAELSGRLDVSIDQLLSGVAPRELDQLRLTLDFAELALESGQPHEAEARAREALELAVGTALDEMVHRGRYLLARALEAQANLDDAILELEPLLKETHGQLMGIRSGIALSRCYRESGDYNQAIQTGERVLEQLAGTALEGTDEAVQMSVTLAAAYHERGDSGQAVRLCRKAVQQAEAISSPTARASAYWNAAMMEAQRGRVHDAVPLAERALALLGEGQDSRNLARLRTQLGIMQLRLDPPQVTEAQVHLRQAADELVWCSAGPAEIARNDLALARALFLQGDSHEARSLAGQIHETVSGLVPIVAADAKTLEGQAAASLGGRRGRGALLPSGRDGADRHRRRPHGRAVVVRAGYAPGGGRRARHRAGRLPQRRGLGRAARPSHDPHERACRSAGRPAHRLTLRGRASGRHAYSHAHRCREPVVGQRALTREPSALGAPTLRASFGPHRFGHTGSASSPRRALAHDPARARESAQQHQLPPSRMLVTCEPPAEAVPTPVMPSVPTRATTAAAIAILVRAMSCSLSP